jgi:hypothetical protein
MRGGSLEGPNGEGASPHGRGAAPGPVPDQAGEMPVTLGVALLGG